MYRKSKKDKINEKIKNIANPVKVTSSGLFTGNKLEVILVDDVRINTDSNIYLENDDDFLDKTIKEILNGE